MVLSQSLGYLWAYPGLIHYILLICENVSLDSSTMQLAGSGSGSGSIIFLKNAVLGLGLGFGLTLTLTLKQYSLKKGIDPDLGPGRDPEFYWLPVITFEFP